MQDCTEYQMRNAAENYISHAKGTNFLHISDYSLQIIKVQLLALGYIEEGTQPKTKKEYIGIWRLTKFGMNVIMRLNVMRRQK